MTTWHATVAWTGHSPDHIDPAAASAELAEPLLEQLVPHGAGAVTTPEADDSLDRWGTTITVEAGTVRQAADVAAAAVTAAARAVGMTHVVLWELDVLDDVAFLRRLERPAVPPLVGYAGAAELGHVTRTRARQLASSHPGHPPVVQVVPEYGPLYVKAAVERFYASREPRKPGRPPKNPAE